MRRIVVPRRTFFRTNLFVSLALGIFLLALLLLWTGSISPANRSRLSIRPSLYQVAHSEPSLHSDPRLEFKIYVYDLPARFNAEIERQHPDCASSLFGTEIHIHKALINSRQYTHDPEEADFFYVPVYAACVVYKNFDYFEAYRKLIKDAIDLIIHQWPYWNRTRGLDHVWTFAHDFGGCISWTDNMDRIYYEELRHSIFLSHLGDLSMGCFTPSKDIVIPAMSRDPRIYKWGLGGANYSMGALPDQSQRTTFAYFRGTIKWSHINSYPSLGVKKGPSDVYSHGVRAAIAERYKDDPEFRIHEGHSPDFPFEVLRSVFCVCPLGFATWSGRLYDVLMLGCIPVIISDNVVLPFEEELDYRKFSLKIAEKDVPHIKEILKAVPQSRIEEMQREIQRVWKRFSYQHPPEPGDAFEMILIELGKKVRKHKPLGPVALSLPPPQLGKKGLVERPIHSENTPLSLEQSAGELTPTHLAFDPAQLLLTQLTKSASELRIYVYDLPPRFNSALLDKPRRHNRLMVEMEAAFHQLFLNSPQRTLDPERATVFYVPVFPVAYCSWRREDCTNARDGPHCVGCQAGRELVREAVRYISENFPYWDRNQGADHVFLHMHHYGACGTRFAKTAESVGFPEELKNAIILSPLGDRGANPGGCFREWRDVVLPAYQPKQRTRHFSPSFKPPGRKKRDVYFRGSTELGVLADTRLDLISLFEKEPRVLVSGARVPEHQYWREMEESTFCLVPPGIALWTPRLVQAILVGCIPVIIDDGALVLPFEAFLDWSTFSLRFSPERLDPLVPTLREMSEKEILAKQRALHEASRFFAWPAEPSAPSFLAVLHEIALVAKTKRRVAAGLPLPQSLPYSFDVDAVYVWTESAEQRYRALFAEYNPPSGAIEGLGSDSEVRRSLGFD